MNEIHIPIVAVHLETRFRGGEREEYALLQPEGDTAPLRVLFEDLREKLGDRFSHELSADEVVTRLADQEDLQLVVKLIVDGSQPGSWEVLVRFVTPGAVERKAPSLATEKRKARRVSPGRQTDIKIELGPATLEGTLYNVSEHGLGIALLTSDPSRAKDFSVDQVIELVGKERIRGRIASQYPAPGGCVLGIELKERFDYARLYAIDA